MELNPSTGSATWTAPLCPVTIEFSLQVLDDIRLAVVDAFFSLPRGGAEIGGVLLGRHESGRVLILDHLPLECEHATGPSFTLSPKDHAKLAGLLASVYRERDGMVPVGWYHSHTRTEIFLSDADQEIHRKYFPEPWQVALVLKPHTFQPTRAGFFFREASGEIDGASSYREFILEPLGVQPIPQPAGSHQPAAPLRRKEPNGAGPVITVTTEPQPEAAPPPAPEPVHAAAAPVPPKALPAQPEVRVPPKAIEVAPPSFAQVAPPRSWRWLRVVLAIAAGVGIGGVAYRTRDFWLNSVTAWMRPKTGVPITAAAPAVVPRPAAADLALRALDTNGQLWITWDHNSAAVRGAAGATLSIHDGPVTQSIELGAAHLLAGSFTYGRQGERIDITLTLNLPNGEKQREVTTYIGKLTPPPVPDQALRKLTTDLNAERARRRELENILKKQQQRRLENQTRDR